MLGSWVRAPGGSPRKRLPFGSLFCFLTLFTILPQNVGSPDFWKLNGLTRFLEAKWLQGRFYLIRKNMLTITTNNGSKFTCHKKIVKAPGTTVYFADLHASLQKGVIGNENKLIRQYIPKGTDFRELSNEFFKFIS